MAVDVLGRAIEAVSGQPLSVFLDERLFRPHRIRGRHAIIVIPSLLDRPWDMPSFSTGFHKTSLAPVVVRWTKPIVLVAGQVVEAAPGDGDHGIARGVAGRDAGLLQN